MFQDRADAGRRLAEFLTHYRGAPRTVVLALPRGGVPVGVEVARALNLPLDVLVVRKLGFPGHEEYAAGAIAAGGVRVTGEPGVDLSRTCDREQRELARRERAYRGDRAPLVLQGMTAILVDDGLATGLSMRAAIIAARSLGASTVVAAVPVGNAPACQAMKEAVAASAVEDSVRSAIATHADEVVCMQTPHPFRAVGAWYRVFDAPSDDDVREMLAPWRAFSSGA
ncbi:Predicted phosphoribosyltransferase [Variovorax sp. OK605]|uniref:phosphoribosyltransferase n=1 Tax=Variovorax sp. OK605 TaxID=1855317 RepID=UPI0008E820A1|nr:phosphoribosyltransferase family protein [Variovorax sp. OK605]SFP84174.1 Predicted phosphoribosyltransferase [Variovorax sp. OK605]